MLLAGRVRKPEEAEMIADVIHRHFKRRVDPVKLFSSTADSSVIGGEVSSASSTETSYLHATSFKIDV